jgi:hypothetical protein
VRNDADAERCNIIELSELSDTQVAIHSYCGLVVEGVGDRHSSSQT